ncbi:expressed unknown protein [Seminavis robusta]|uniref:Uncharacterized protein n=1 Tax=Seminavis robusta TaxID=568900 RepID=A0A9N8EJF1_9STRA|nr:expressed unknown protein [Seminavis robusta]|eukprot:Sro1054_g235970.1 n/a (133) ;mRNA; r:20284-20682
MSCLSTGPKKKGAVISPKPSPDLAVRILVASTPGTANKKVKAPATIMNGISSGASIADSALYNGTQRHPSSNNNTLKDEKSDLGKKNGRTTALVGNTGEIGGVQLAAILRCIDNCLRYCAGGIDCDFFRFKG